MTDYSQVYEALESSTQGKKQGALTNAVANASSRDHTNHRDALLRFLNEIEDPSIDVGELISILEEYRP